MEKKASSAAEMGIIHIIQAHICTYVFICISAFTYLLNGALVPCFLSLVLQSSLHCIVYVGCTFYVQFI